jgi:hypothetical protein
MRTQGVLMTLALGALVGLAVSGTAEASSHREAPFIAKNPKTDATDLYVFRSYELGREGYVTFLANYQPFQGPYGGPNFFAMDDQALYEIEIDNVGDGKEHLTFQFQFSDPLPNGGLGLSLPVPADGGPSVAVPFLTLGGITAANQAATSRNETYTVTMVTGDRRTGTPAAVKAATGGATSFQKPVDYIGPTTLGNAAAYEAYARSFITDVTLPITGCTEPGRVWVGQRAEPFGVNLGVVFDLLGAPASVLAGGNATTSTGGTPNPIGGFNVTTIGLEVPISCLATATQPIIGAWTTASVRQARVINPTGTYATPTKEGGAWAQVSRLGMPLVNELVIGLKDKDTFNSSAPSGDAQFLQYVTNPTLPAVIEAIFGPTVAPAPSLYPRADLEAAFLTGVTGVNANGSTAEMIRFNTSFPVTYATGEAIGDAGTTAGQQSLGAALCFVNGAVKTTNNPGCDVAGFPNGRRPGDDVVDIALRVVEGFLIPGAGTGSTSTGVAPGGDAAWNDTVLVNDSLFTTQFPYFNTPNPG